MGWCQMDRKSPAFLSFVEEGGWRRGLILFPLGDDVAAQCSAWPGKNHWCFIATCQSGINCLRWLGLWQLLAVLAVLAMLTSQQQQRATTMYLSPMTKEAKETTTTCWTKFIRISRLDSSSWRGIAGRDHLQINFHFSKRHHSSLCLPPSAAGSSSFYPLSRLARRNFQSLFSFQIQYSSLRSLVFKGMFISPCYTLQSLSVPQPTSSYISRATVFSENQAPELSITQEG